MSKYSIVQTFECRILSKEAPNTKSLVRPSKEHSTTGTPGVVVLDRVSLRDNRDEVHMGVKVNSYKNIKSTQGPFCILPGGGAWRICGGEGLPDLCKSFRGVC